MTFFENTLKNVNYVCCCEKMCGNLIEIINIIFQNINDFFAKYVIICLLLYPRSKN